MSEIYIGKKFSSYDEFQHQLQKYSAQSSTVFWKRDSRNLDSVKGKVKKAGMANPKLKYYFVRVCCVRGGRTFKKKKNSTGQRLRTTKREDCPAFISLSISNDGQYLEISAMNLNHTHDNTIIENKRRRRRKPKPIQEKEHMCYEQENQSTLENNEPISNDGNLFIEQCNENFECSKTMTPVTINNSVITSKKQPLTQHQRYLEASRLTAELTVLISELSENRYRRRIAQIEDLIRFWKSGLEVTISPIEKSPRPSSSSHPAVTVSQQVEIDPEEYLPSSTSSSNELDKLYNVQSSDNVVYLVVDSPNDLNSTNVLEIEKALKNNFQLSSHNPVEVTPHEAHQIKAEEYLLPTTCSSNVSNQSYIYDFEKELKGDVQISNENSVESSQPDVALEYYEVTINDCDAFTNADSSTSINSPNGSKKVLLEVSPTSRITNESPVIHQFSKKRRLGDEFDSMRISLPKKNS